MPEGSPPPTLVHVITGLGTGGAERSLEKLAEGLADSYRQEVISLLGMGPVGERIAGLGVPVHTLGMGRGRPGPYSFLRLVRLLRRLEPDLLQGWMHHGNLAVWAAAKLLRWDGPIAWSIREMPRSPEDESMMAGAVTRLAAAVSAEVSAIIYNARASAIGHRAMGFQPERTIVIPNGFLTDRFRPRPEARACLRQELGAPADAPLIGLMARFHPIKDHRTFLRAASKVIGQRSDVHAVLAGRGIELDNPELSRWIDELGLRGRVHLLGSRGDVERIMAGLDVACLSSRAEGFPNVVGEAMACGVPCVVTDVGDAAYMVGETGVVVPPRDPGALARGVSSLLGLDEAQWQQRSAAARSRIAGHFTLAKMIASYDQLYKEMLDVRNRWVRTHSKRG